MPRTGRPKLGNVRVVLHLPPADARKLNLLAHGRTLGRVVTELLALRAIGAAVEAHDAARVVDAGGAVGRTVGPTPCEHGRQDTMAACERCDSAAPFALPSLGIAWWRGYHSWRVRRLAARPGILNGLYCIHGVTLGHEQCSDCREIACRDARNAASIGLSGYEQRVGEEGGATTRVGLPGPDESTRVSCDHGMPAGLTCTPCADAGPYPIENRFPGGAWWVRPLRWGVVPGAASRLRVVNTMNGVTPNCAHGRSLLETVCSVCVLAMFEHPPMETPVCIHGRVSTSVSGCQNCLQAAPFEPPAGLAWWCGQAAGAESGLRVYDATGERRNCIHGRLLRLIPAGGLSECPRCVYLAALNERAALVDEMHFETEGPACAHDFRATDSVVCDRCQTGSGGDRPPFSLGGQFYWWRGFGQASWRIFRPSVSRSRCTHGIRLALNLGCEGCRADIRYREVTNTPPLTPQQP